MKTIKKLLIKLLSIAIVIFLIITFWPSIRSWLAGMLPNSQFEHTSTQLSHTMESKGDLVIATYTDTGVAYAKKDAALIGTVAEVNVPYQYEINFGFPLSEVTLTATEKGITVKIPPIRVLSENFSVTGEVKKNDFWRLIDENSYQRIINDQAAACLAQYTANDAYATDLWNAACKALTTSLCEWSGDADLPLTYVK